MEKIRTVLLPEGKKKSEDRFSHFHTIHQCDKHPDG